MPEGSVSVTDQPSGARPSQASSNCTLPGIDFIAMLRSGPGRDEVRPHALGAELAGEVAAVDSSAAFAAPIQP